MNVSPQQRREDLRTVLLQYLKERAANAFPADVLLQRINKTGLIDFEANAEELSEALAFLRGSNFIALTPHAHGATPFYQVTSAGVLAHERGTLNPRPL
jgi:hypothetical protein